MTGKAVLFGLLLLYVTADAAGRPDLMRKPSCPKTQIAACPMNFAPVCGSDGNTYANECTLCAQSRKIKMEILIAKEESC
ncbi:probable pancreatic secretory proteinase inhibitor [Oryzias latipes]|uniref:probable pancreatic secretory proteinase inhibitor n=1 Tax=Oryzias latipes TaxID=8090 RepID=UPI0002A48E6E|nr:probable pancreatic secretory proteinase inhibitor [Oryzias latipes]